ncbi:MAG: hypothetical protein GX879_11195 [Bacteroidales bacterium]|nr:hypothetical protein [Bacteroidales bacterium]
MDDMISIHEFLSGKNINFLIGSGASAPLFPTLSLGNNMPSFEQVVCWPQISDLSRKIMYAYYYARCILPMQPSEIDKTTEEYNTVFKNYIDFVETLITILLKESNERPKRANIFTTNYDLMFEIAFDEFRAKNPLCYFNDGSCGFIKQRLDMSNYYLNVSHSGYNDNYRREIPTINLFKMHGSISWEKLRDGEDEQILVNYLPDLNEINEVLGHLDGLRKQIDDIFSEIEEGSYSFEQICPEINDRLKVLEIDDAEIVTFYEKYLTLPIINPDKWKFHETVYEQNYYQMIRSFSYEMEKKDTVLLVFGFSFADEHIKDILKRSMLNPTLKVIIVAYSAKTVDKLKNMFAGYRNIEYYPKNFNNSDGIALLGNFRYFIKLLKGQCKI